MKKKTKSTLRVKRGGADEYPPGWALGAGAGDGSTPGPISENNPFTELNTSLFVNKNNNNGYDYTNNTKSEISIASLPSTTYRSFNNSNASSNSNNSWLGNRRYNNSINFVPEPWRTRELKRRRSLRLRRQGARRGFHNEASTITEGSTYQNNNGYNSNSNTQNGGKRKYKKTLKKRQHH